MKQLGWCSIEQSEKLIEAGLDTNTADMTSYTNESLHGVEYTSQFRVVPIKYNEYKENFDKVKSMLQTPCFWEIYPCWSLAALIGLLPKTIETKKPKNLYFPEILPSNNCVAYTALNERKEMVFLKMFATGAESDATLIDNMVSMICWLLENNYIKKGNKL